MWWKDMKMRMIIAAAVIIIILIIVCESFFLRPSFDVFQSSLIARLHAVSTHRPQEELT